MYFPRSHHLPARSIRIYYMKGKTFKIKNAMVTFISIEYSEPKILTWNLYHHSPSYLAILFCLREKLARHVPLLDSPVNFCRTIQFSNCLVVCHTLTFLRSNYVQTNLFLIHLFSLCDSFFISQNN